MSAYSIDPIAVTFEVNTSGLDKAVSAAKSSGDKIANTLDNAGKKAGKLFAVGLGVATAAVAGIAIKATKFIGETIGAASDLEESLSKTSAVFGPEATEKLDKWASGAATAFGQSKQQALEAASSYGNLLQAFGLSRDQALGMSTDITQLASDLASFNNTSVDDALLALRSGLSGETEPLKRFGVALSEVRLKEKAEEMGLIAKGAKGPLSVAIKAQASYALILQDTALAQGDYARTSDGLANSQRTLEAEMANLKTEIGVGFMPVLKELVIGFRDAMPEIKDKLVPALVEFGETFAKRILPGIIAVIPFILDFGLLLVDAFENATPAIDGLVNALPHLLEALLPLIPSVIEIFTVFAGLVAGILPDLIPLIGMLADNAPLIIGLAGAFYGLVTVVKIVSGVMGVLNAVMALNPITLIVIAVAALVAGIVYLATQTTFFQDTWQRMTMTVQQLWFNLTTFFTTAGNTIKNIFTTVVNTVKSVWQGATDFIAGLVNTVIAKIRGFFDGIANFIGGLGKRLYGIGKDIWNNFVQGALDALFALPQKAADILSKVPGLSGVGNFISSGISGIKNTVSNITGTGRTATPTNNRTATPTVVNNYNQNISARGLTVAQVQTDAKRRGTLMRPVGVKR